MFLIVLALIGVVLVALNCFYNLSGLFCYVTGMGKNFSADSVERFAQENYRFDDSDFDV